MTELREKTATQDNKEAFRFRFRKERNWNQAGKGQETAYYHKLK